MKRHWDCIVVGLGGIGSAAAAELAVRGLRVLGVEQFGPAHHQGSSHGRTRMIRQAYFEHPDYVPLAQASFRYWEQLQQRTGTRLLVRCGLLQVGPPQGEVLQGVCRSAEEYGLPIERLSAREVQRRWPGFRVPPETEGVYEPQAGFLYVERCVRACLQVAAEHGAELRFHCPVKAWRAESTQVRLDTAAETLVAETVLLCGGAWMRRLVSELAPHLRVVRKPQYWFSTADDSYRLERGVPGYLFELPFGVFYGFPEEHPVWGVKMAMHSGGRQLTGPEAQFSQLDPDDYAAVRRFARECLPRLGHHLRAHVPCMYTLSPDEHFLLGRHPGWGRRVWLAAGLSGHGFKFAGVLGQALAEQIAQTETHLPVGFLDAARLFASPATG